MSYYFPLYSTSVMTDAIERTTRVMRRTKASNNIGSGGVFVCKKIVGSNTYSQHSWGNAVDLFPKENASNFALRKIADAVVWQTTHRTTANRGRKLDVAEVIDHNNRRIWTPSQGWYPYGGTTGAHIHVSGAPLKTGIPACAR